MTAFKVRFRNAFLLCAALLASSQPVEAQPPAPPEYAQSADGFVSARGERAIVMGYRDGLEMWAYPLQLLSGYRVRFHVSGKVDAIEGDTLLRRVEQRASEAVRVYVGADFVVRERLFVPRREAGAIITYEIEGRPDVNMEIGFRPSLDLMWPGALGGQEIAWDAAGSAYVEREPLHGFSATIASREAVAYDTTVNAARGDRQRVAMLLQPRAGPDGMRRATLTIAADPPGTTMPGALGTKIAANAPELRREADSHAAAVLAGSLRITTPDEAVNRALASATLALDQAWVCAPGIGCSEVAGYGPSRPGRRPQYAWFFAGDGLVAMRAMLDAGQYERAREELAFVARYQDKANGMIWHEMSLSAPLIDWANRYPYMFVHVDISFQYLAAVQSYVEATGDIAWARDNWRGLTAAWGYCTSILDPATDLPRIPAGKQGQNEQDALRDDIRLSSAWIDAADGFARLARATDHGAMAADAERRAATARESVARDGWDAARGFWLSGHTLDGAPVHNEHSDALPVLDQRVFTQARIDRVLDRIASPEFTTDWGLRNLSANAPGYDPNLYGSGSVWALGTAAAAATLWHQHWPLAAGQLFDGLIAWNTLDSSGHIHELLAGDLFHPEVESVPEQTWSSAGVITSAVEGLLGIAIHGKDRLLGFAPHLPARWAGVSIGNLHVGAAVLDIQIVRDRHGIAMRIDNAGQDVAIDFAPSIPIGAQLGIATIDDAPAPAALETHAQDRHARVRITARHGATEARIAYEGGLDIATDDTPLAVGDPSRKLKIDRVAFANSTLTVEARLASSERDYFDLFTAMNAISVAGARLEPMAHEVYRVHLRRLPNFEGDRPMHAVIVFESLQVLRPIERLQH